MDVAGIELCAEVPLSEEGSHLRLIDFFITQLKARE